MRPLPARLSIICAALILVLGPKPIHASGLPDLKLPGIDAKDHSLTEFKENAALVVTAHGLGCPILRQNFPTLVRLEREFAKQKVQFVLINSNAHDSAVEIAQDSENFGIQFPILLDSDQKALKALGLSVVGETLIIRPSDGMIVYRGPIDDRVNFDRALPKAKHDYLKAALSQFLANQKILVPAAAPLGCAITRRPSSSP